MCQNLIGQVTCALVYKTMCNESVEKIIQHLSECNKDVESEKKWCGLHCVEIFQRVETKKNGDHLWWDGWL